MRGVSRELELFDSCEIDPATISVVAQVITNALE